MVPPTQDTHGYKEARTELQRLDLPGHLLEQICPYTAAAHMAALVCFARCEPWQVLLIAELRDYLTPRFPLLGPVVSTILLVPLARGHPRMENVC